jgi:transposase
VKARAKAKKRKMPLRVMFQDEARFGRVSRPRACWAPRPMRPEVSGQMVREYVYVFGAVSPNDGRHDSLVLPYADTEAMSRFLKEVAKRHPRDHMLMFMDQAGWHKSRDLKVPDNIELAYLPPHSPELNPQEQVWDELREKFFGNRFFGSIKAVVDRLVEGLRCLESAPHAMASLTQRDWM